MREGNWEGSRILEDGFETTTSFILSSPHPELYGHVTFGPFHGPSAVDDYFAGRIHPDPALMLFAIIDKTQDR